MTLHSVVAATSGGVLIGLAASMMLLLNGRIAGISGIVGGALTPGPTELSSRLVFLAGLLTGGVILLFALPGAFDSDFVRSPAALVAAGLLVGAGVRLGSGCTSGHGVCGISRFSPRSITATVTFMLAGAAVAAIVTQAFGGVL